MQLVHKGRGLSMKITVSSVIGAVGGFVASFLGGIDQLLITLITFIVLDYITGVVRAIYEKELSSAVGFKGIIKKVLILLMVGVTVSLEKIMPAAVPLREMTVLFFVANEGFSIIENAAELIPLPERLKSVLAQLKNKSEENSEAETKSITKEDTDRQKDPLDPTSKK